MVQSNNKLHFYRYLIIWLLCSLSTIVIIMSQTDNIILRMIGFPTNIIIVFIIARTLDKKRLLNYLKIEYPETWQNINIDDIGNIVTIEKIRMSETLLLHLEIPEVLKYHKRLMLFQVWSILHILALTIMNFALIY